MIIIITLILFVLIMLYLFCYKVHENYSMGAYTQLVARGPQDEYEIGDVAKYYYWPYYTYGWPVYDGPRPKKSYRLFYD